MEGVDEVTDMLFDTTTIPDELPSNAPDIDSTDLSCEVCGTPITYAGRGRKPTRCDEHKRSKTSGTGSAPRRNVRNVEAACAALDGLYQAMLMPLFAVSPDAGAAWVAQIEQLNARNRIILSGDPALARKIVDGASKGGGAALLISHVIAVGPVASIAVRDVRTRRAARQPQPEPENATPYEAMPFS